MFFDNSSSNLNSSLSASQTAHFKTTPIAGFGGYIPGEKWRIGTNIRSPQDLPNPKGPNTTLAPLKRPSSRRTSAKQGGRGYAEPYKSGNSQHTVVIDDQRQQIEGAGHRATDQNEMAHSVLRRASSAPRNDQRSRPEGQQQRPDTAQYREQHQLNGNEQYQQQLARYHQQQEEMQQQQAQQQYQQPQQQHAQQQYQQGQQQQAQQPHQQQAQQPHQQQGQQPHQQQGQQQHQQGQQQQQQGQQQQGQQQQGQQQGQQRPRSKSTQLDGRVVNNHQPKSLFMGEDIFAGLEKGWWSQGEVERNKQRREQALRGQVPGHQSQVYRQQQGGGGGGLGGGGFGGGRNGGGYMDDDKDRIPAPGYSGHMPGLRENDYGKPWTIAAKESRENHLIHKEEVLRQQQQAQVH